MNKDIALKKLKKLKSQLRQQGVLHAGLFGSLARGKADSASDIDILLDLAPDAKLSVYDYVGLKRFLAEQFHEDNFFGKVDVVESRSLKPALRQPILNDVIYAF